MYTQKQIDQALSKYEELKSVMAVIQKLGYPTRMTMYNWINEKRSNGKCVVDKPRKKIKRNTPPSHPWHPALDTKLEALRLYSA